MRRDAESSGPMTATTLSVQGLSPDAAVEIVQRKIARATSERGVDQGSVSSGEQ